MMMETLAVVAIASVIGAVLNTIRGYLHSEEPYSIKKLAGSIIIAIFAALAISQTIVIDGMTEVGAVIIGLVTGFSADYVIAKSKTA